MVKRIAQNQRRSFALGVNYANLPGSHPRPCWERLLDHRIQGRRLDEPHHRQPSYVNLDPWNTGVLAIAPLFKKIVLITTKGGIGSYLPVIMERRVPGRILWSTKNPERTYSVEIVETVKRADQDA